MIQRPIEGWPDHWYNSDGFIPCPARGCNTVFHNGTINRRHSHWGNHYACSPSYNDHGILQAINSQTECPYCDHPRLGLRSLFAHEEAEHGSSNMSTIQGYLHLMRQGLDTNEARACRPRAHARLMDNIWESEYRNRLLFRAYPRMLTHEALMEDLELILCYQNRQAGLRDDAVVLSRDFLTHLRPKPGDQSAWPETYHALRDEYAEGNI